GFAAGVLLTAGGLVVRHARDVEQLRRQASEERARRQAEAARMSAEVDALRGVNALLSEPATRVIALHGTGPAPAASGRLVWHAERGGYLFVSDLPAPSPGRTYQLWVIDDAPRSAGVFEVDPGGHARHPVAPSPDRPVRVFAVTLEPAGGVPAPTGPIVLASR
ncbi:MAG TPA: anti-sigma factor, partial [Candidatus Tectomicrobia bacterium]|nr:anti-sigma factor [Candidatus Tectomicrobia bacterium]